MASIKGFLCSSNDAKACYDRILHSVASLTMQRIGMPLAPIKCMLKSLQEMQHFIKTSHGISARSDGATLSEGKPVYKGQAKAMGPVQLYGH